ncbi:unnamed protein product [Caenorhabditis angaria]|uniref:Uncharacterized protein n=1 Tax=Caenorhabditis angaria TaxID=860376 RepID=A0A9P1J685_9PELO|nr:unnamed protein product [Caenorhabditis angaria]
MFLCVSSLSLQLEENTLNTVHCRRPFSTLLSRLIIYAKRYFCLVDCVDLLIGEIVYQVILSGLHCCVISQNGQLSNYSSTSTLGTRSINLCAWRRWTSAKYCGLIE